MRASLLTTLLVPLLLAVVSCALPADALAQVSVELTSNRPNPYKDEIFTLTLSVRAEGARIGQQMDLTFGPDKDKLELDRFKELPVKRSVTGGKNVTLRRFQCRARALNAGSINLPVSLVVEVLHGNGPFIMRSPRRVNADPLRMNVRRLPQKGRPKTFSGAVGQFSFSASASPTDLSVGDLVKVTMSVYGEGHMEGISPPGVAQSNHFKVYDVKLAEKTAKSVVYEQTLVPQSTNAVEIGSVSFSYFDPLRAKYNAVTKGPFHLSFREKKRITVDRYEPLETASGTSHATQEVIGKGKTFRRVLVALGMGLSVSFLLMSVPLFKGKKWVLGSGLLATAVITGLLVNMIGTSSAFMLAEVRMREAQTARFAPAHSSLASFDVRKGALVGLVETHRDWSRIRYAGNSGWVPSGSLED